MADNPWNRKDHFYQNSIKVLSADDPTPGYDGENTTYFKEDVEEDKQEVRKRVYHNGLYRLVYLIRYKLSELRNSNWSLINLNKNDYPKGDKLSNDIDLNELNGENTFGDNKGPNDTVGNFYHTNSSSFGPEQREQKHYPKSVEADSFSSVIKVSAPGGPGGKSAYDAKQYYARQNLLQNMNHNMYERIHNGRAEVGADNEWSPWYVFVPIKEDDALELGLIGEDGEVKGWDKVFLKKKNDATTGPITFGNTKNTKAQELSSSRDIKIMLSSAIYGNSEPDQYFNISGYTPEKGQIYLQLESTS